MDGSIDFLCFPHFDSPTIFARAARSRTTAGASRSRPCLETVRRSSSTCPTPTCCSRASSSEDGVAEISDFMPVGRDQRALPHDRAPREDGARRGALPHASASRASTTARASARVEQRDGRGASSSPTGADGTALRLRTAVPVRDRGRRRGGRVHAARGRDGRRSCSRRQCRAATSAGRSRPTTCRVRSRSTVRLLARAGSAARPTRAAGARWSTARR